MKVIKIGATWCPGCIVMRPRWKEIEAENAWLDTEYYDYDEDFEKAKKYITDSDTLPTFIFLDKSGIEIDRIHGEPEKADLVAKINEYKDK